MCYKKLLTRTDCKAKIRLTRISPAEWRITHSKMIHNYQLVPVDQAYMLRLSRTLSKGKMSVIDSMAAFGIGVNIVCGYMEKQYGGR